MSSLLTCDTVLNSTLNKPIRRTCCKIDQRVVKSITKKGRVATRKIIRGFTFNGRIERNHKRVDEVALKRTD